MREWREPEVEFLRRIYGESLELVLEHTDETYPHFHAYVLPQNVPGCDGTTLYPGKAAKKPTEAEAKKADSSPGEALKIGNRVHKAAMRGWQHAYFREALQPAGLTWEGPQRRRLTRAQW